MSTDTVHFDRQGNFTRGPRVENLDVNRAQQQEQVSASATPAATSPTIPTVPTTPPAAKPGSFSLASLRSSIQRSAPVAEPEPEPVPEPEDMAAEPELEPEVSVEQPVESATPVVEESVAEVDSPADPSTEEVPVPTEQLADEAQQAEVAAEEPAPEAVPTFKLSSLSTVKQQAVSEGTTDSGELTELHLDETMQITPAPEPAAEQVSVKSEEPALVKEPVTAGSVFNIVSLDELVSLSGVAKDTMGSWANACLKQRSRAPGAIFCYAASEQLRFYNYIDSRAKGSIGVVIGYGNNIAAAILEFSTKALRTHNKLTVNGDTVVAGSRIVVTASELKQEAIKA